MTVENGKTGVAGYVLAGGASSRFGRDKALAVLEGKTVLARMCDLVETAAGNVSVVAAAKRYPDLRLKVIEDRWPGEGPLGGIITALRTTEEKKPGCDWNLILSCDMPFLTSEWLEYMTATTVQNEITVPSKTKLVIPGEARGASPSSGFPSTNLSYSSLTNASDAEVVVPKSEHGLEPLCACWRTDALEKLQDAFDKSVRKVIEAMKRLRMEVLDETHWKRFDSAGRLFWNMNTPQDYEEAVRILETENA